MSYHTYWKGHFGLSNHSKSKQVQIMVTNLITSYSNVHIIEHEYSSANRNWPNLVTNMTPMVTTGSSTKPEWELFFSFPWRVWSVPSRLGTSIFCVSFALVKHSFDYTNEPTFIKMFHLTIKFWGWGFKVDKICPVSFLYGYIHLSLFQWFVHVQLAANYYH